MTEQFRRLTPEQEIYRFRMECLEMDRSALIARLERMKQVIHQTLEMREKIQIVENILRGDTISEKDLRDKMATELLGRTPRELETILEFVLAIPQAREDSPEREEVEMRIKILKEMILDMPDYGF